MGKFSDTFLFTGAALLSGVVGITAVAQIALWEALHGKRADDGKAFLEDKRRAMAFYRTFSRIYDSVNPSFYTERMRELAAEKGHIGAGSLVLDVGCGTGYTTEALDRETQGGSVTGLDMTTQQLARARRKIRSGELNASLTRGDADRLPFSDSSFDATVSVGALEHLPDPDRSIAEMARVVRPGGWVVVGGPERAWFSRVSLDKFLHSLAQGELERILRGAGLEEVGSTLIGVDTLMGTARYVVLAYGTKMQSAPNPN